MIIYAIFTLICLLLFFLKQEGRNGISIAFLIALGFFLTTGYTTGSDWRNYEVFYENAGAGDLEFLLLKMEPGFVGLMYLFSSIGVDFWIFLISLKIISYFFLIKLLLKTSPPRYFFLALFLYLIYYGFYIYIDNPLRNMITITIMFACFNLMAERKFWLFLIMTLVATSIHTTAIIMLPIYFIAHSNYSTKTIIWILLIVNILFLKPDIFQTLLKPLGSAGSIIGEKIEFYTSEYSTDGEGSVFPLRMGIYLIFISLIIYSRKEIEALPYGRILFNLSVLFIILVRIGFSMFILSRFQLYIAPFYLVTTAYTISCFTKKSQPIYLTAVILFSGYIFVTTLVKDCRYIPYTNYVHFKLTEPDISYRDRSAYNEENSAYPPISEVETF